MNELKANVGDLVRVVVPDNYVNIGDIVEIEAVKMEDVPCYYTKDLTFDDGTAHILWEHEFELYLKNGEEDETPYPERKAGEEEPTIVTLGCYNCGKPLGETAVGSREVKGAFCSNKCAKESEPTQDAVNHPNHYTQGKFETIEIIEEIAQGYSDGYVAYCVGNAIKYLSRAPHKHVTAEEDLRKAVAYINFALERVGR